jgi:Aminoglycoside adenylyltransferase, C-terminal domain
MSHTPSYAPPGTTALAVNPAPTPYAALNAVLGHFVGRVQELLADNFIGAYLQGSFALGHFDGDSDVDFLLVMERDIADRDVSALNALHAAIHEFPKPWGHRLEGSYSPAAILRRLTESPRDPPGAPPRPPTWVDPGTGGTPPRGYPLLFLDHGARTLVRSEHDNTRVVRWVTRERGIVLAGPDPRALIDEVSAEDLRNEMRETMARAAAKWLSDLAALDARWLQAFAVGLYCRMLHTLETGVVTSKKAAAEWALVALDARWHALIVSSAQARPSASPGPADPRAVAETKAFMRYALQRAGISADVGSSATA